MSDFSYLQASTKSFPTGLVIHNWWSFIILVDRIPRYNQTLYQLDELAKYYNENIHGMPTSWKKTLRFDFQYLDLLVGALSHNSTSILNNNVIGDIGPILISSFPKVFRPNIGIVRNRFPSHFGKILKSLRSTLYTRIIC